MTYMNSPNELLRNQPGLNLYVAITSEKRAEARKLAKSKGMTFQGWLALIIERELENATNKEARP